MPSHDWTRVPVGLYHHFHQSWAVNLPESLNFGPLPEGYFALVDQRAVGLVPDVWRCDAVLARVNLAAEMVVLPLLPPHRKRGTSRRKPIVRYTLGGQTAWPFATRSVNWSPSSNSFHRVIRTAVGLGNRS